MDLFAQRRLIAWQVGREPVDLDHDHRRKTERDSHRQAYCSQYRKRPCTQSPSPSWSVFCSLWFCRDGCCACCLLSPPELLACSMIEEMKCARQTVALRDAGVRSEKNRVALRSFHR